MNFIQEIKLEEEEIVSNFRDFFRSMLHTWIDIGFNKEKIRERIDALKDELINYFEDVEEGEIDIANQIQNKIENLTRNIDNLKRAMHLDNMNAIIDELVESNTGHKFDVCEVVIDCDKDCGDQSVLEFCQYSNGAADSLNSATHQKHRLLLKQYKFYTNVYDQLRKINEERKRKLSSLIKKQDNLCSVLNETKYEIENNSFVDEIELHNLQHRVNNLSEEKRRRVRSLKRIHEDAQKIQEKFKIRIDESSSLNKLKVFDKVRTSAENSQNQTLLGQLSLDEQSINAIRKSLGRFEMKRDELIETIDLLVNDIKLIWAKFDVKNAKFESELMNENLVYNQETLDALLHEYNRSVSMKCAKLDKLIEMKRAQIAQIWSEQFYGKHEKMKFEPKMRNNQITDELFEEHDQYLQHIKSVGMKYERLIENWKRWMQMWNSYLEFEVEYSDPNRFKQRNYNGLAEERERRRFETELPKIEKKLKAEAQNYLQQEAEAFTVEGLSIPEYIESLKSVYYRQKVDSRKTKQIIKDETNRHEAQFGTRMTSSSRASTLTRSDVVRKSSITSNHSAKDKFHTPVNGNKSRLQPTNLEQGLNILKKISTPVSARKNLLGEKDRNTPLAKILKTPLSEAKTISIKTLKENKPNKSNVSKLAVKAAKKRASVQRYRSQLKRRSQIPLNMSGLNSMNSTANRSQIPTIVVSDEDGRKKTARYFLERVDSIEERQNENLTILNGNLKGGEHLINNNNTSSGIDSFASEMPLESPVHNSSFKN